MEQKVLYKDNIYRTIEETRNGPTYVWKVEGSDYYFTTFSECADYVREHNSLVR